MTEVSSSATPSAIDAFGRAFLDYVRNLTPQVILLAAYVLADVQAATIISGKWQWQVVSATCLIAAVVATFFNIAFFMRDMHESDRPHANQGSIGSKTDERDAGTFLASLGGQACCLASFWRPCFAYLKVCKAQSDLGSWGRGSALR
jgi:membrane protein implicated in regulation of membrane protease activity